MAEEIEEQTRDFILNQEKYDGQKALFEKYFIPHSVYQIAIIIPYLLPIGRGTEIASLSNSQDCGFMFAFETLDLTYTPDDSTLLIEPIYKRTPSYRTYVEIAYITPEVLDPANTSNPYTEKLFSNILNEFNNITAGFGFMLLNPQLYSITNQMLNHITLSRIFSVEHWASDNIQITVLNSSKEFVLDNENYLIAKDLNKIMSFSRKLNDQPFLLTSEKLAFDGLKFYSDGLFKEAVVNIQTSIESFVISLFIMLEFVDGKSLEDVMKRLETPNLKNTVEHHFHKRIGGSWNCKDTDTLCGKWYTVTYALRNNIVHMGHEPKLVEANNAIKIGLEFREYIFSLIMKQTGKYESVKKKYLELYGDRDKTFAFDTFHTRYTFDLFKNNGIISDMYKRMVKDLNA